jgi:UrcA family protein
MKPSNALRRTNRMMSLCIGAVAAGLISSTGMADERALDKNLPSVEVSYSDLNLTTEAGVKSLQQRIVGAARQVCGTPGPRHLSAVAASRACQNAAISRAMEDVQMPMLAAAVARSK